MSMKPFVTYTEMESLMGPLTILSTEKGICRIDYGNLEENFPMLKAWAKKVILKESLVSDNEMLQPIVNDLDLYFHGHLREFHFPLDLYGTIFQKKVWESLLHIPYGETRSYKEIAKTIHAPKAVRAVGSAINRNPVAIVIPCHRVIGSNGSLVGYNGGLDKKEKLLEIENALEKIS
jgi:methylated-DNA-[protein]-cysteine S-methyltransferase